MYVCVLTKLPIVPAATDRHRSIINRKTIQLLFNYFIPSDPHITTTHAHKARLPGNAIPSHDWHMCADARTWRTRPMTHVKMQACCLNERIAAIRLQNRWQDPTLRNTTPRLQGVCSYAGQCQLMLMTLVVVVVVMLLLVVSVPCSHISRCMHATLTTHRDGGRACDAMCAPRPPAARPWCR